MKSARLLLLMACLLVATSLIAAAYEPTNGIALDTPVFYGTKTIYEEEVAIKATAADSEKQTIPVVPIPKQPNKNIFLMAVSPFVFKSSAERTKKKKDHRASSRFT